MADVESARRDCPFPGVAYTLLFLEKTKMDSVELLDQQRQIEKFSPPEDRIGAMASTLTNEQGWRLQRLLWLLERDQLTDAEFNELLSLE